MMLNGLKPWIVSKEDEQTHMTSLNSMRVFQNCDTPIMITGTMESVVVEQIHTALKTMTERVSRQSNHEEEACVGSENACRLSQFREEKQNNLAKQ